MMEGTMRRKLAITAIAWLVAGLNFFRIAWMFLTGCKTEVDALSPSVVLKPTLENFVAVQERAY